MHYGRNRTLEWGRTRDTNLPKKRRNAQKMVILTNESKNFIKAKLTVSKSCLLGPTYFMICCILGDAHLKNLSFLRRPSTEFIFFNFSDIATYPRKLGNQNQKLLIFLKLLSENSHSVHLSANMDCMHFGLKSSHKPLSKHLGPEYNIIAIN